MFANSVTIWRKPNVWFLFFSSVGFFKVRKIQKIDKYEMKKMQGEFQISSS